MSDGVLSCPIAGLSHQRALWEDQTDQAEIAMVGPLGCGKSFGLAVKQAMLRWVNKGVDGMLVCPTFSMARMIHIPEWPGIWESLGLRVVYETQRQAFLWPWGSRTWIRSAENPARLAGPNLGDVMFDEPGQIVREAYERGAARARHPKARVRQKVLGGTPEGLNFFADLFADPDATRGRRTIWARSWHRDMRHYPQQLVDLYGYDESLLATYVGGKFVPLRVGRCYSRFDRAVHQAADPVYDPNLPLLLGCDFNVDAMRWEVAQITPREIRFLDEIALGRGGDTEAAAREFVRRWRGRHRGAVVVTGDPAGQARSTSGRTDYQIIREELSGKFFRLAFSVAKAHPRQKDRVDATNYHLAGRGRRIVLSKRCRELALDWERVHWRPGTSEIEKPKTGEEANRTHASDAADYLVWQLARPAQTLGSTRHGVVRVQRVAAVGAY